MIIRRRNRCRASGLTPKIGRAAAQYNGSDSGWASATFVGNAIFKNQVSSIDADLDPVAEHGYDTVPWDYSFWLWR
jgi:hypothetical protein